MNIITIEVYPRNPQQEEEILEFLQKNGYEYTIENDDKAIKRNIANEFLKGYDDEDSVYDKL